MVDNPSGPATISGDSSAEQKSTEASGQHEKIKNYAKRSGYFLAKFIELIDKHNGLVTAIGTVFLAWLTFSIVKETHREGKTAEGQLTAMQTQSRVMQGQLEEMKRQEAISKLQLLPDIRLTNIRVFWVSPDGVKSSTPVPNAVGLSVTPILLNAGSTSAFKEAALWGLTVIPSNNDPSQYCSIGDDAIGKLPTTDFPGGQKIDLASRPIPIGQFNKVVAGQFQIVIIGHLQYQDGFPDDPPQRFDWCLLMIPNTPPDGTFSFPAIETSN